MTTLLKDLIDIPLQVSSGDFVLSLADGVQRPQETVDHYVLTPQLSSCFDDALKFIQSALDTRRSKAAYLHGSFGAGKSHFMAILLLLLQNHPEIRRRIEFESLLAKHPWVQGKKFLLVPYHLIGSASMESAILGGYASYIQAHFPDAPIPGVYLAESIFEDAERHRHLLGDARFFQALSEGKAAAGWGKLASGWDAQSYDKARSATVTDPDRVRLVGDLVSRLFKSVATVAHAEGGGYVGLGEGLAIISQHARALGFDGLILFLDELILWLATRSQDLRFVQTEGTKLAKLVEAEEANRPIPIISFVARQRDLRELVGKNLTGAEQLNFSDILGHWEGRFKTISLEDRNLPEIVSRRILKPLTPQAESDINEAFDRLSRMRESVLTVLLTERSDKNSFRKVYPFSPALVDALIEVSSALQRERTALKIMVELLVEKRDTLELGQLIPVGDLFDTIQASDPGFSDIRKFLYETARKIYRNKLLPMLEEQHGVPWDITPEERTADPEVEQKWQDLQNDARIIKTLLLAAMVEVEALKNLTGARLHALNYGSIKSPIPGGEGTAVLTRIRTWASRVGEIKLSGETNNPFISIQLTGIDTDAILSQAMGEDNLGNRRQRFRQLLYDLLDLPENDRDLSESNLVWKGTKHAFRVKMARLRDATDEALASPGEPWQIWLDFPFDDTEHHRSDAGAHLNDYRGPSTNSIVWIPSFFSNAVNQDLGRLVVLDHILHEHRLPTYLGHLALQEREQARTILTNQRDALQNTLRRAIEAAYGLTKAPNLLAGGETLEGEEQFRTLRNELTVRVPGAATMADALRQLVAQGLEMQFPGHPNLGAEEVRSAVINKVWNVVSAALDSPQERTEVDRTEREKVRQVAQPLHLGDMGDMHFSVKNQRHWLTHFNQRIAGRRIPTVSVDQLYRWMDEPQPMGLPPNLRNLVVLTFARQTDRSFYEHGAVVQGSIVDIKPAWELRQQNLPDETLWIQAVERAAQLLEDTVPRARTAVNLDTLVEALRAWGGQQDKAEKVLAGLKKLDQAAHNQASPCPRCQTVVQVRKLANALKEAQEPLRTFVDATENLDLAHLKKAASTFPQLMPRLDEETCNLVRALQGFATDHPEAARQYAELQQALVEQEFTVRLEPVLAASARLSARLAVPPPPPIIDPPKENGDPPTPVKLLAKRDGNSLTPAQAQASLEELTRLLQSRPEVRVHLRWQVWGKEGG